MTIYFFLNYGIYYFLWNSNLMHSYFDDHIDNKNILIYPKKLTFNTQSEIHKKSFPKILLP